MSDPTEEFFDALSRHGSGRVTRKTSCTVRFDLEHEHGVDHWSMVVADGEVKVFRDEREADTVLRTTRAFFDRMALGEAKPLSAWLRNDITSEGEFRFIVLLERLFESPRAARHPRDVARVPAGDR